MRTRNELRLRVEMSAAFVIGVALVVACGSAPSVARVDRGSPATDAGSAPPNDASRAPDHEAEPQDAADDAPIDGPHGASDVPAIACADTVAAVYVTPSPLPAMTLARRGDIVRCARGPEIDLASAATRMQAAGVIGNVQPTTGVATLRIAFRTTRSNGADGVSTALVYLPHTPRVNPAPLVVVAHPTVGLAAACAPSATNEGLDNLALPFAATGYVVIAPDLAGLGNGGVQGYLDNVDGARSFLDAARAVRKLLASDVLASRYLAVGFSQGGGVVLSSQALDRDYGDGQIAGVVAIAAEWQTRVNSFGFVDMMRAPTDLTISTGISKCVVQAMRSYAYFVNFKGAGHAGDAFPVSTRSGMIGAIESQCFIPLGGYVQGVAPYLGQLFDDDFRASFLRCVDTSGACASAGPGAAAAKGLYDFLVANIVRADPQGAPVLYVQGLLDSIMRPDEEAACNLDKLRADGITPQVCIDGASDHGDAPKRTIAFAMKWGAATLSGVSPPTCSASGLPACNP